MIKTDKYKLYKGDCLKLMKDIPDKSVDLVLIDPPYNIKKAKWDSWKTVEGYVEFMGKVFLECQRVLKDNGSFYFFHNDFLQIVELQNWINKNTEFIFKQFLVWNKRFEGGRLKGYLDGHCAVESLRNYKQMVEYCLFYTFQNEKGMKIVDKKYVQPQNPFRKAIIEAREKVGLSTIDVAEKGKFYGKVNHGGSVSNWEKGSNIPTKEQFSILKTFLPINQEYEDLRKEYENLRYTFNNQKKHHSVMNYEIAKKQGHITPKPTDLLKYIIKTSSNKDDVVLDCFMGSGSTGVACLNTDRRFIGIELDNKYFDIATERIENTYKGLNKEIS
ncbi:DNA-methyltransferase [Clostridium perfringens]|jgi:site-specific DNA-methyltransferase (adenine-specific)|uniref:Methyltransferase n=1 Tax=Clostridium perfringens TaxID=1502 RepID=A0AAW4IY82_CLOPF|nr:site-specific DNA-methyltransferase [Clostridium perfringens]MBO3356283.1 site-specific DNA-methyltransferase [Clostridium perfringens]MBO3359586.1 site-specific DNA-methyltransferase [Clostridium perfringens]